MVYLKRLYPTDAIEQLFSDYEIINPIYTAHPNEVLANFDWQQAYPIVIEVDQQVVGFFVLDCRKGQETYQLAESTLLLRAFSIDQKFLRRGYAKLALQKLPQWLVDQQLAVTSVYLAVNHRNIAAQQLYLRTGFKDTKQRFQGIAGEQYLYELNIENFLKSN